MTPNQFVAHQLRRIRSERGWTQEEAAAKLEPHIGSLWSKAVWSAAETSAAGNRRREFTADEIVAFARAFDVPVAWFFMSMDSTRYTIDVAAIPREELPSVLSRIAARIVEAP